MLAATWAVWAGLTALAVLVFLATRPTPTAQEPPAILLLRYYGALTVGAFAVLGLTRALVAWWLR